MKQEQSEKNLTQKGQLIIIGGEKQLYLDTAAVFFCFFVVFLFEIFLAYVNIKKRM
jgi:hypothetical protein